jgi:exocyst complex component 2
VEELDKTLFEGYVKPKATAATSILRAGILDPNMDWYETPQPTGMDECSVHIPNSSEPDCYFFLSEIRPYMYETLIYIVSVHAHISSVSEGLLERTLGYLVTELAEEALRCFRQVKRFGMGGMLRVRDISLLMSLKLK